MRRRMNNYYDLSTTAEVLNIVLRLTTNNVTLINSQVLIVNSSPNYTEELVEIIIKIGIEMINLSASPSAFQGRKFSSSPTRTIPYLLPFILPFR